MKFRWTIKELKEKTDYEIVWGLITERNSELNPYCPLHKRLDEIYIKLRWGEQLTKPTTLKGAE